MGTIYTTGMKCGRLLVPCKPVLPFRRNGAYKHLYLTLFSAHIRAPYEATDFSEVEKKAEDKFLGVMGIGSIIDGQGYFCREKTPFTYEMEGKNCFDLQREPFVGNGTSVLFDDGEEVMVYTEAHPVRFLLVSGKPLGEPVAWYGPIVMNTQEELELAFDEYQQGTFIKHKR